MGVIERADRECFIRAGGSGLVGLKDRVEALGGRLSVHSPLDAGTTVRAELPLSPARPIAAGAPVSVHAPRRRAA